MRKSSKLFLTLATGLALATSALATPASMPEAASKGLNNAAAHASQKGAAHLPTPAENTTPADVARVPVWMP